MWWLRLPARGSVKQNTVQPGRLFLSATEPPCSSAIRWARVSPQTCTLVFPLAYKWLKQIVPYDLCNAVSVIGN